MHDAMKKPRHETPLSSNRAWSASAADGGDREGKSRWFNRRKNESVLHFFAFDPRRRAIVLVGGDKTGDARCNDRMIARADALFAEHLYRLALSRDGSNDERKQP